MPDTFTPLARLEVQQTGANNNTWGVIADATFTSIEDMVLRETVIDLTGLTTYPLTVANNSPDQARCAYYKFIGALAANCTVTLPSIARQGQATDATTGGKSVILTCGGGTTFTLPKTGRALFSADGTNTTAPAVSLGAVTATSVTASNLTGTTVTSGASTVNGALTVNGAAVVTGALTAAGGSLTSVTTTGEVVAGVSQGNVHLTPGGASNTGYIAFYTPANVRAGYIGFGAGGVINFNCDAGFTSWNTNANLNVGGTAFLANAFIAGNQATFQGASPTFAALGVTGNTTTNGVSFFGPGGQFYANPNNSGAQLLNFAANQYIQFVPGFGFSYNTTGQHNFTGTLNYNGVAVVRNDGGTYALNITGTAAFAAGATNATNAVNATNAATVPWGGVSGVPGQISSLNQFVNTNSDVTHNFITTSSGLVNHGTSATDGFAFFGGGTFLTAGGMVMDTGGVSGPRAWNGNYSIQCLNSCAATVFSTFSDGRFKDDITDITPEDGVAWVLTGRPRRYVKNGRREAGFVAQEDLHDGWDSPRGESVGQVVSADPRAAESDGFASDGQMLMRDYHSDSAWLTAALQWALGRISTLEDRIVALERLVTE